MEVVTATKFLSTLLTAVKKFEDLVEKLNSDEAFTVFAPTDKAFDKVDNLEELLQEENKDKLEKILLRHVIPTKIIAKDIPLDKPQDTAGEEKITFTNEEGKVKIKSQLSPNGEATVIKTDIDASNGVVHIVDTVL